MDTDIQPQAAARVGSLIFCFARLDFVVSLALRNLISAPRPEDIVVILDRLNFKAKIDALADIVPRAFAHSPQAVAEFGAWYERAEALRTKRNAFVHGRWGMQSREVVFNASPRLARSLNGEASTFTLSELDAELESANQVLTLFNEWHSRRVLDVA